MVLMLKVSEITVEIVVVISLNNSNYNSNQPPYSPLSTPPLSNSSSNPLNYVNGKGIIEKNEKDNEKGNLVIVILQS